ncbi:MAG: hypothetical protein ABR508_04355, partial [Candidatus Baltobacteraceae bacterium]
MSAISPDVKAIADAVLYEGFLLFPYKPSAVKNRMPWQFGVLMPLDYADASEATVMRSQMLTRVRDGDASVDVLARFLQQTASGPLEHEVPLHAPLREGRTELPFEADVLRGLLIVEIERDGAYCRITLGLENRAHTHAAANRNEALERALIAGLAPSDGAIQLLLAELTSHLRALLRDVLCGHLDSDL